MESSKLLSAVKSFTETARELYLPTTVPRLDFTPTPLQFYRDYVSKNIPCIFTNMISHWKALEKWDNEYLENRMANRKISVAVTSNGLADSVVDGLFMLPEERKMSMNEFIEKLKVNQKDSVYYLQKQNSCLVEEFSPLLDDVDPHIELFSSALGSKPDAINFWMGSENSITSLHKDHYENAYAVIRGSKTFTLLPPTDRLYLKYENFRVAEQKYLNGQWEVRKTDTNVPWIALDPLKPNLEKYPLYKHAKPLEVTVREGEVLYLPSMWFHHVRQSDMTVAVNYWYDMQFDNRYSTYQFCDNISSLL